VGKYAKNANTVGQILRTQTALVVSCSVSHTHLFLS